MIASDNRKKKKMKKYVTINEICEMFQIKKSKLYKMTAQGLVPHLKIRNQLRFDPEKVEQTFIVKPNRRVLA